MNVLVSGATGKLGPYVVGALRERGVDVSALVRDPAKAEKLLGGDVELVAGRFDNTDVVSAALGRVDGFLLLTPHGPDMATTQNALVDLAAAAGTRVVKVSGTSSGISPTGPDACRQHYETEQYLAASGVAWAVVRPNGFMQTLVAGLAATVRERGAVFNPLGSAGIALVDCADVGAAAAAVLCDPDQDSRCHVLTGPSAPTYAQMAQDIERLTGHTVSVQDVTPAQAAAAARAKGLSDWEAGHLGEMLELFRSGAAEIVTDDLPRLLGRPAGSVAAYIADNRRLFLS
jgi:uncharacterized protein YbjT (DUF2867 family)